MMIVEEKFDAAISDTDLIIDLYKSDCMNLLSLLFNKIYITEFIFEKELKKVSGSDFEAIKAIIEDEKSPFEIVWDNSLDIITKNSKKALKSDNGRQYTVGPGELDCACYAHASGINFVVSNNHTEFQYLDDIAIMLSHFHILAVCVFHNKISENEAAIIYNAINQIKTHPSSHSFSRKLDISWNYFYENSWLDMLKLSHYIEK